MATVSIRYIVDDVDAAIPFYCEALGFDLVMHPAPPFAMLERGSAATRPELPERRPRRRAADARRNVPAPGGWNRFAIEVDDIDATVARLREAGVTFRNEIVDGVGGRQIIAEDPSGNPVELFQPTRQEARLASEAPGG